MQKDNKTLESTKEKYILMILYFLMTLTSVIFGILSIAGIQFPFVKDNFVILSISYALIMLLSCCLFIRFVLREKEVLSKMLFSGCLLLTFCLILVYVLQKTGFFTVIKNAENLQEYLKNVGAWMPIAYIILQYLQVIILPIPSVVSTVAGVALFNPVYALIYSLIGIILGSFTAFLIGRKIGHKAVAWMIGKETLDKWQNKLKGKDNIFLTIMFILPMFPDDVLCFIAGLSSMSTKYFLIMIMISRVLTVSGTCFSFNFIPFDTWWGLLIWGLFFALIIIVFILAYKNMNKLQAILTKPTKIFRKNKK